jgi:hypothetical protein
MKKSRFALLSLILLARPCAVTAAQQWGDFIYRTDGSSITVTGYTHCWPPGGTATIPDMIDGLPVTRIWGCAFWECYGPTSVTIPSSVTNIGVQAFASSSVRALYCRGNAPGVDFDGCGLSTVYYLPGTTGWGPTLGGRPTAPWVLPNPLILTTAPGFGVRTNGFGFVVSWATNASVVVEACTDLAHPNWSPVATNALSDGWSKFSDLEWTNHPGRFYRIRSP